MKYLHFADTLRRETPANLVFRYLARNCYLY
jgi:hypothetical protein